MLHTHTQILLDARAARVTHYTWTISVKTQNTSIWSMTAAAPSDSVFHALCTNLLTYLLR